VLNIVFLYLYGSMRTQDDKQNQLAISYVRHQGDVVIESAERINRYAV
jgi:hypothetical protein